MGNFNFGILVFIGCFFLSRFLLEKGNKQLSPEKKAELLDMFSKNKAVHYIILFLVLAGYLGGLQFGLIDPVVLLVLFAIAMVTYSVVTTLKAYNQLINHDFPMGYIKNYLWSSGVRNLGFIAFFSLMILAKDFG